MASDEKHARELIERLRAQARDLARRELPGAELLDEAADALEAALPGDDDWEWGYELRDAGTGDAHRHGSEFATAEEARAFGQRRADEENETWANDPDWPLTLVCVVVRRRPARPWEPVEEVPRG